MVFIPKNSCFRPLFPLNIRQKILSSSTHHRCWHKLVLNSFKRSFFHSQYNSRSINLCGEVHLFEPIYAYFPYTYMFGHSDEAESEFHLKSNSFVPYSVIPIVLLVTLIAVQWMWAIQHSNHTRASQSHSPPQETIFMSLFNSGPSLSNLFVSLVSFHWCTNNARYVINLMPNCMFDLVAQFARNCLGADT